MPISTVPGNMIGNSQIGGQGSNSGVPIYENPLAIASSYSISTGSNAMSPGPMTINDGITVVVPDGSTWTIV
jgi:hypothetical protein